MSANNPALVEAVRELLVFVKAHRVAGDADLEAALARVEYVLQTLDATREVS